MTDAEYADVWTVGAALWPKAKEPTKPEISRAWRPSLDHFEGSVVQQAVRRLAEESGYFPTLHALLAECREVSRTTARARRPVLREAESVHEEGDVMVDARTIESRYAAEAAEYASVYHLDLAEVARDTRLGMVGPRQIGFLTKMRRGSVDTGMRLADDYGSLDELFKAL
jgi:hypothetical protein